MHYLEHRRSEQLGGIVGKGMEMLEKRGGDVWQYTYDTGDVAYITVSMCMILVMIPGLGFLYSGLARRKSALSMIWVCFMGAIVAQIQWYFWGYSLAFSPSSNRFIGNLDNFGLKNILKHEDGSRKYPELLFAGFQGMFCSVTVAIVVGGVAERGRLLPAMIFAFCWATIVYCPIAFWIWGPNGWAGAHWDVLDFAGGGPVEIASGIGGLAYSFALGRRKEQLLLNFRPHNVSLVTMGTALLWFGWLGFNGGSALGSNLKAVYAVWNSNIAACFGALTWCLLDFRLEKKWSTVAICSGIISGLVAATPCSGIIPLWASVPLGIVAAAICNFSTQIKYILKIDDSMDTFAEHGVAGIVGLIFNAFFGADYVIGLDGSTPHGGGWVSNNWKQIYKQICFVLAASGYTFVMTVVLCYAINFIPGCKLRASEEAELRGMDEDQIGEFAYDYVEVRRDWLAWTPPTKSHMHDEPEHSTDADAIEANADVLAGSSPNDQNSSMEQPPTSSQATSADDEKNGIHP
ncbi:ammonium transporter AmtB-like domain-containing protein [Yarrowia lipolytica]|jgi:Amt family ammonium transporter|nr:hypothetical protein YALI1_F22568g [Yarrowia lipolytica]KAB8286366.1 ammonium transporter AmtB-like domain-containing protein [Yarrowia lipolytica]KAE8174265.1 ammonium transporter AmtB-like domain-containing protein [Yarrowia lipolytica]QNQ01094.1 Ammonium transporter MEP1 [Yarrowia lipolytica]RDW25422.1 ammonium transporter AmtB-like domain-containing protein [Yarrowia lipolytica]